VRKERKEFVCEGEVWEKEDLGEWEVVKSCTVCIHRKSRPTPRDLTHSTGRVYAMSLLWEGTTSQPYLPKRLPHQFVQSKPEALEGVFLRLQFRC